MCQLTVKAGTLVDAIYAIRSAEIYVASHILLERRTRSQSRTTNKTTHETTINPSIEGQHPNEYVPYQ